MTDDNLASKLSVISKQKWIHIVIYYINWTEINVLMLITVQFKSFLTVCFSKDACDIESSIGTAAIIYCVMPAFLSCYVRDCVPSSLPYLLRKYQYGLCNWIFTEGLSKASRALGRQVRMLLTLLLKWLLLWTRTNSSLTSAGKYKFINSTNK